MNNLLNLSLAQLKRAVAIKEQIQSLESEFARMLGEASLPNGATDSASVPARKKGMSPEARAKIAAAQRARWKKLKATSEQSATTAPVAKRKRTISPAARKKMAEAAKARWAKIK